MENIRPLSEIAADIRKDWKKVSPFAEPYLKAMSTLNTIQDYYDCDSGEEIVLRFLSNSTGWRGEVARRIKAELKTMCNIK